MFAHESIEKLYQQAFEIHAINTVLLISIVLQFAQVV